MSKITISTFELFKMFPDQEAARVYLEGRLWPAGVKCPVCGLGERITARKGGFHRRRVRLGQIGHVLLLSKQPHPQTVHRSSIPPGTAVPHA
jgi:hypothetical protein